MISPFSIVVRRMMSTVPTSNFITLSNRPIVQNNGETVQDSLKLHYWEWKGHQPTILLCHAASFHGRCYDQMMNEALNGFHVIALDFRGHGRSQQCLPPYRFRWLGEDVVKFLEALNLSNGSVIGIGHSTGGYALLYAAATAPKRLFRSLLVFDPPVAPVKVYGFGDKNISLYDPVLRRKNQWSSIEEMLSKLEKREPFSRWSKDILKNYCTYAVDENCKLVCPPEAEHSMYHSALQSDTNIYPLIEQSKFIHNIPIHIVRSSVSQSTGQFDTSPTVPTFVKSLRKGRQTQLESAKHFFPMEEPELMIKFVKQHIQEDVPSKL